MALSPAWVAPQSPAPPPSAGCRARPPCPTPPPAAEGACSGGGRETTHQIQERGPCALDGVHFPDAMCHAKSPATAKPTLGGDRPGPEGRSFSVGGSPTRTGHRCGPWMGSEGKRLLEGAKRPRWKASTRKSEGYGCPLYFTVGGTRVPPIKQIAWEGHGPKKVTPGEARLQKALIAALSPGPTPAAPKSAASPTPAPKHQGGPQGWGSLWLSFTKLPKITLNLKGRSGDRTGRKQMA